jgi:hypothetical protein
MNETLRSMLLGPAGLYVLAGIALVLTFTRHGPVSGIMPTGRFTGIFLAGVALQGLHAAEEFAGGFHIRFPQLLGLAPWPDAFFMALNLAFIALWLLAAIGLRRCTTPSLFLIWFFTLAAIGNAVFHPLIALVTSGYFPGLITAPFLGIAGIVLLRHLLRLTAPDPCPGAPSA